MPMKKNSEAAVEETLEVLRKLISVGNSESYAEGANWVPTFNSQLQIQRKKQHQKPIV